VTVDGAFSIADELRPRSVPHAPAPWLATSARDTQAFDSVDEALAAIAQRRLKRDAAIAEAPTSKRSQKAVLAVRIFSVNRHKSDGGACDGSPVRSPPITVRSRSSGAGRARASSIGAVSQMSDVSPREDDGHGLVAALCVRRAAMRSKPLAAGCVG
jgi:hypothetical protein